MQILSFKTGCYLLKEKMKKTDTQDPDMKNDQDKLTMNLVEKQILDRPWVLTVFLYVLIPTLTIFNIYCALSSRFLATAIITLELVCFLVVLICTRSTLGDLIKIRIYRYCFSCQILILTIYLIFVIGFLRQLEVCPWAFLSLFFLFLWMPNRMGGLIAVFFNLALLFFMVWPDPGFFMTNSDYLIRFFFSLALFSILSFCSVIIRRDYLKNLFQTQRDLEVSEHKYRDLSQRLQEEIKHRDRIEKQLHHAIKMETVGKVAAGVAHDLNNILSGIVTYPDLILLDLKKQDPLRGPIETIKKSGLKAAAIVDDLLTLSRRGVPVSKSMDIRQITEEYLHSPEFRQLRANHSGITLSTRYDASPMTIKGSPVHMFKVLMNLVSNSAEAMPGGGEILIHIQAQTLEQPEMIKFPVQGQSEIPVGDYVVLSVEDCGVGIGSHEIEFVFEPFYTQKVMGRSGTGLGMAVVLGTVNDHRGFVQIDSVLKQGTRVTLFFPTTLDLVVLDPMKIDLLDLMGNHEKILVIDDVSDQLAIAEKLLTRLGYQVWCCKSGEDALVFLKDHAIDLVLVDMIMAPGMGGIETCEHILARYPDQKTLFVTGFSDPDQLARARKLSTCLFKPYTLEKMATLVQNRLKNNGFHGYGVDST
jgi:signal transduction histidine kinase